MELRRYLLTNEKQTASPVVCAPLTDGLKVHASEITARMKFLDTFQDDETLRSCIVTRLS